MLHISAPQVLIDGALRGPRTVAVGTDGRIAAILDDPPEDAVVLRSGVLTPGLLDLHLNGAFGVDFAAAPPADWTPVLRALAARGVTGVQPTFVTAPLDALLGAPARCAAADRERPPDAARVLGAHLEGPFLARARKGAHRAELLVEPTEERLDRLLDGVLPRTVTLAPERPGALAAVERLARRGVVVSVGHTDATAPEVRAAADAGATLVTHLFNAQRPLHHRKPGVPGAALTDPRLLLCLIVDGVHVHPDVMRLAFAAAPGRIVAVTDAILTAGVAPGTPLDFGGLPVANDATGVGRRPDGTLAGAGITLDEGVRRTVAAGIGPAVALSAATEAPARALGRDDLGRVGVGAHADLVHWDDELRVRRVWLGGRELRAG